MPLTIPPPTQPATDSKTGQLTEPWYRYFNRGNLELNSTTLTDQIQADLAVLSAGLAGVPADIAAAVLDAKPIQFVHVAASNETTNLVVANNLVKFRMPYAFTLTSVRGSLSTAQATGTLLQFDITHNGTTIFSTRPTFDNTETTTQTAATASVLSTTALSDDAEMIVNLTARGVALAKGLKVTLIGRRT